MVTVNCTKPVFSEKDTVRFWSKVDRRGPDECWLWLGSKDKYTGYGRFQFKHRRGLGAHRAAFLVAYGYWPENLVCHVCDNRSCCNPAHLFEGTYADNNVDAIKKGRAPTGARHWTRQKPELRPRGEKQGLAKLTEGNVREIIAWRRAGMLMAEIASRFGVHVGTVRCVLEGRTWKDVTGGVSVPRGNAFTWCG